MKGFLKNNVLRTSLLWYYALWRKKVKYLKTFRTSRLSLYLFKHLHILFNTLCYYIFFKKLNQNYTNARKKRKVEVERAKRWISRRTCSAALVLNRLDEKYNSHISWCIMQHTAHLWRADPCIVFRWSCRLSIEPSVGGGLASVWSVLSGPFCLVRSHIIWLRVVGAWDKRS